MTDRSHHHDWRQNWDRFVEKASEHVPVVPKPEPVVVVPEPEPVVEVHEEPEAPVAEAETHE